MSSIATLPSKTTTTFPLPIRIGSVSHVVHRLCSGLPQLNPHAEAPESRLQPVQQPASRQLTGQDSDPL
jgi:hypothetical protein